MKKFLTLTIICIILSNLITIQNVRANENSSKNNMKIEENLTEENPSIEPYTDKTTEIENILKEKIDITEKEVKNIQYKEFIELRNSGKIKAIYWAQNDSELYGRTIDDEYFISFNPQYETFKKDMLEEGIIILDKELIITQEMKDSAEISKKTLFWFVIIIAVIILVSVVFSKEKRSKMTILNKRKILAGGNGSNSPTEDKKIDPNAKTFSDVAGLEEVKKDMSCLVDFIKNKEKYTQAGAKLPKGVILYGPPGTGKTLLAKAVAGEANIPFIYMSGSDFIELYVGVGAKRVRELFEKAKKSSPCIIFIDEIDAIGGTRNSNDTSGEDRKTINALLTEMDGFNTSDNILVIGATNRIEDLDPALLRPGRFTNKYCVPLPSSAQERLEIIEIYAKNKKFAEDVDFNSLSKETIGFSPAQIESLLNEAAIISVQDKKNFIDKESIEKAMFKILLSGHAKEDQSGRDKKELELVAYHEAGHALVGKLLGKEINKVTILASTSGAGGVTFSTPSKMGLQSVEDLKNEVKELYGGRIAEFILYKNNKEKVTTGASNDIERATSIIKEIISSYGMTDSFGLLNLSKLRIDDRIIIEEEIKLAKQLEQETLELLTKNKTKLNKIAKALLEKETLYEKDLDEIILGKEKKNENS